MHGSAEGADYSRSHTRLETERIANRDGHLTDTQLLGISESNVGARLTRARQLLAEKLKKEPL